MASRDLRRTLLLATLPIAVLLGGGMALVLYMTSPGPARAPPDPTPPPGPPIEATPAPLPPPGPAAAPRPTAEQRAGGPTRGSWIARAEDPSSIPMAGRVIRKIVRRGLLAARVQARLARCADQLGGVGDGPVPRGAPAILRLELEGLEGEVRIADAAVQQWGGASEAAVACARGALRGQVIGAAPSRRGEHTWMPYPLNPRGEALAASP